MSKKWALWLVIGGLGVDLVDAFTTKSGSSGGFLYGPTGVLKGMSYGKLTIGEIAAMVGAAILFFDGN
jgi:hypothetical protein